MCSRSNVIGDSARAPTCPIQSSTPWPSPGTNRSGNNRANVAISIATTAGFRSATDSHREIAELFGREVVSLTLVNPNFYHLDTAISVLDPLTDDATAATGLPSARAIVERHGGHLELDTVRGQGTLVRVELPVGG